MRFLGLCGFYRQLVPHYSDLAKPLHSVTQENKLKWTQELEESFTKLKKGMAEVAQLYYTRMSDDFILETDASLVAVGAVLKQKQDGIEVPIQYFSKSLSKSQRNYSTYERELLAVVLACEKFRIYLIGRQFVLRTDHAALRSLFTGKLKSGSKAEKYIMRLQPYSPQIIHIKGTENEVADALSRDTNFDLKESIFEWRESNNLSVDEEICRSRKGGYLTPTTLDSVVKFFKEQEALCNEPLPAKSEILNECSPGVNLMLENEQIDDNLFLLYSVVQAEDCATIPLREDIINTILTDLFYLSLIDYKLNGSDILKPRSWEQVEVIRIKDSLKLINDILYYNDRILLPRALRERLVDAYHSGIPGIHQGAGKVYSRILPVYYWPGIKQFIKIRVGSCNICGDFRNVTAKAKLQPISRFGRNHLISVDCVGFRMSYQLPLEVINVC